MPNIHLDFFFFFVSFIKMSHYCPFIVCIKFPICKDGIIDIPVSPHLVLKLEGISLY